MTPPTLRPLTVGEILDTSFSLYRRHFAALATVALVCAGLPLILRLFLEASGGMLNNLTPAAGEHGPNRARSPTSVSWSETSGLNTTGRPRAIRRAAGMSKCPG